MLQPQRKFKAHSEKQSNCIFSEKKIIILACGIQFGKTISGAMRMKILMHRHNDPSCNFIITAPTYKVLQQATLPAFLKVMEGYGHYNKVDALFKMTNGGTCFFRTASDPDSIIGITDCFGVWGDEAGLYSLYFHENIQARASFKQAQVIYTTSPYAMNWIYTDYIRPHHRGLLNDDEVLLVQARSDENPYFPKAEYERKKNTMDPRRFSMVYGGQFHKLEGLVYSCFDEEIHVIDAIDIRHMRIIAGVDFGYTNPAAIEVLAFDEKGNFYLIHEWYRSGKTITEMINYAAQLKTMLGIERFYCDPSSPANIQEFNKRGLTAIAANNDIRPGIDVMYETIAEGRFKVFKDKANHFLDNIAVYHYKAPQDIKPDHDVKDHLPVKQNDHAMDAVRYALYSTKLAGFVKKRPVDPSYKENIGRGVTKPADLTKVRLKEEYEW